MGLCEGFCPITCDDDKLQCSQPNDPLTGCARQPICIDKAVDIHGFQCDNQYCPLNCEENAVRCEGPEDIYKCKGEDTCVTKESDNSGGLCPGICPVYCNPETEVKCESQVDPTTGCKTEESCLMKARDINGEVCPDDSASHGCPIECPQNTTLCPAKKNLLGCKEAATCQPIMIGLISGEECPQSSNCPTVCEPDEVSVQLPNSGHDENGCLLPNECVKQHTDYDGEPCSLVFPGLAGCDDDTQIECPGHLDDLGCETEYTCVNKGIKDKGNDVGGICPGHCPARCSNDEVLCASQEDCDGCLTAEVCKPKAKNTNGDFCPDDSASHGCPVTCNEETGQVLCHLYEDILGCKPKATCVSRPIGEDGQFCPSYSVCPKTCEADEMVCADGYDSNNCKNADCCLPRGRDIWGDLCPINCPPKCTEDEYFCPGLMEKNGCLGSSICVEKKIGLDGFACPEVCPIPCRRGEVSVFEKTNANGCFIQDSCEGEK